jgi:hypothetical protein
VDLFYFTMQQLAPNPLQYGEGDPQTVRAYLRHWLHRYHYPDEPRRLLADSFPGNRLQLDASGLDELLADTAEFYGLQLPNPGFKAPATIEEIAAYVQQQLLASAA